MKRALILLLLVAVPAAAAQEKWWEAYNRGIKAVNAKNYAEGAAALQKAIAEMPSEGTAVRTRNESIVYVPHFWLGIAKFNLGDVDGALREWKTSEEQGAIEKTDYYSKLRDWVSRAQAAKVRSAHNAATESKNAADGALSRALAGQMEALSAGADRSDAYRVANRKLQEALSLFNSAGTDIKTYERAAATAGEAREMFGRAADEAKKAKAARPMVVAQKPSAPAPAPTPAPVPAHPAAEGGAAPLNVPQNAPPSVATTTTVAPPPRPVETAAVAPVVEAKPEPLSQAVKPVLVATVTHPPKSRSAQLESAYRAFAVGDFATSERALTSMVDSAPSAEAFLLRGCARYTRAMLSRTPDKLLASARSDFKSALKLNRALRLDRSAFSPKLIAFFEEVRRSG
ncbi:MAG: hypothetical protein ACXW2Q_09355 [Thermoanaerobaculia bacterium]